MLTELQEKACAKLNLTLDVLAPRGDGYHDLRMVMQTVSLHDDVTVIVRENGPWRVHGTGLPMPEDQGNLAWKAAEVYFAGAPQRPGLEIRIDKRIPSQAGLAGGSADAAAVLRALNRQFGRFSPEQLAELALQVGSDVPYCLVGGTMLAEGRGERLRPLPPLGACSVLVVKPGCAVSTPELFHAIDSAPVPLRPDTEAMCQALGRGDLRAVGRLLCNVFEPLAMRLHPEIGQVLAALRECYVEGAAMTGTGSACFALFEDAEAARRAQSAMQRRNWFAVLAEPV